ncbi:MAG: caspase family protein, partial [Pseudomonadota bacterium]
VGGPGYDVGNPDAPLCLWDIDFTPQEFEPINPCPEGIRERYSVTVDLGLGMAGSGVGGGGSGSGGFGLGAIGSIGSGGSASDEEEDEDAFEEGRVVHHAPTDMVLSQPYFLELAIQPITASTDIAIVDRALEETIGSGTTSDSEAPDLALEFTTTRASELMEADLIGSGFDISPTTDKLQPLIPGEATIWQWEVIPTSEGDHTLTFSLGRAMTVAGREVTKSVLTAPKNITVQSIDDLLEDPEEEIAPIEVNRSAAEPAVESDAVMVAESGCVESPGSDADRHALLVTNLAYLSPISRLSETHQDGERLTSALNEVGFSVTHCRDLGQRDTVRALSKLGRTAKARTDAGHDPVTFFYYSGHGANLNGTNYILPVDLDGASEDDLRDGGVKFEDIYNRVSSAVAPLSFVVFDACRTLMDDESRGLVRSYQQVGWARGVFQAFATEPGQTAADDGLYSKTLANLMVTLSEPANVLFKRVQDQIGAATNYEQNPNYIDRTIGREFFFVAGSE